jgi:hypothetical protein
MNFGGDAPFNNISFFSFYYAIDYAADCVLDYTIFISQTLNCITALHFVILHFLKYRQRINENSYKIS